MSVKNLTFVNNNPPACDDEFLNSAKDEINTAVTDSGQTPAGTADTSQLSKGISNYVSSGAYYSCTNIADAYTLTPVSPFLGITGYKDGQIFRFRPSITNTTQSPTANINGQGVKNIVKADGSTQVAIGEISTTEDIEIRYDLANDVLILPKLSISVLPRGYISGIITENDSGDTAHYIKFNTGVCKDVANSIDIDFSTPLVKQIDAVWAAGTNQGGFPSGLGSVAVDTWYHLFVIAKPDGTTDAGFDTSLTATNLLADATGYTKYRHIFSVLTDGSANILGYNQIDNETCEFKLSIQDASAVSLSTGTGSLFTVSSPLGIKATPLGTILAESNSGEFQILVQSGNQTATAATGSLFNMKPTLNVQDTYVSVSLNNFTTDTSSQLRIASASGNGAYYVNLAGWHYKF